MFYTVLLVFVVSCFGRTFSQTHLDDECQLTVWWDDTAPTVVKVPETCLEGEIAWNYPQGNIYVTAVRSDVSYSLCIEESWFTVLGGVVELTGGANTSLPLPTEEKPTCTQDVDGMTELEILASEPMLYLTNFKYRIVSPQLENQ